MSFMKDFEYLKIQMKDILLATNNFDTTKVIGRGGFGKVYKGELPSPEGQVTFAFKQLDRRLGQGSIEFWKEVMMLSKYKHENLISLTHFCIEGDEMILVYEYASRGSLDRYLSDANTLTWIQRLKICVGAAHGIHFLHDPKKTQQRLLHRDIKSPNILLDENWTAKVSDFGLSKLGPANQAHTYLVSHGVGTLGYCDPLYMELGFLSKESDVYSFGVVLFEIMCGRLCYEYCNRELSKILVPKWRRCSDEKRLDEIILPGLKEQMDPGSLKLFSDIAYQCVMKARKERPMMAEIVEKLELSLKQQEIFENTAESSHKERTSLMLSGQMDQSPDHDHRLKFKSIFQDWADHDYSQSASVSDEDESYDSEEMVDSEREGRLRKSPTLKFKGGVAADEEVSSRPKTLWDHYNSNECPDEEFKKVFRMSKATFNMICDEIDSALTKKDTKVRRMIPVPQRVAVCLYRLATGVPLQTVSDIFGLGKSTCHKLVLEVCVAIRAVLMPKFLHWPDKERLELIKTEFGSISGIPNVSGSIHTTHIWIIVAKSPLDLYFNIELTNQNRRPSYLSMLQGVVDSRGVFTDVCVGPGELTNEKILEESALSQRFNTGGDLKNMSIVGGSSYRLRDWLLVPYTYPHLTFTQHAFNEKIGEVQKIAKDAFMRLKGRWVCLKEKTPFKLQDLQVVLEACCVLHNICEINNEAMDNDLKFDLFDEEIVIEENYKGKSVNAVQVRDIIAHNTLHHGDGSFNYL